MKDKTARDYVYMWWRDGFGRGRQQMNFQTGYYVMAADVEKGSLCRLGVMQKETDAETALRADQEMIDNAETVSTSLGAEIGGVFCGAGELQPIDFYGKHSRILESGVNVQRMDMMYYDFPAFPELKGRMEIAAFPQFAVLHFSLFSHQAIQGARIQLGVRLPDGYQADSAESELKVFSGKNGYYSFFAPQGVHTEQKGQELFFSFETDVPADQFTGFGVCVMPHTKKEASKLLCRIRGVQVEAEANMPALGAIPVSFDRDRQFFSVDTTELTKYRNLFLTEAFSIEESSVLFKNSDFEDPRKRAHIERVFVQLQNSSDYPVQLPICFEKHGTFPISGLCPFLRDADTQEPIGTSMQLSKNWHKLQSHDPSDPCFYAAPNDPKRYMEGPWLHAYALVTVPARSSRRIEYTCTFAEWGGVYAASHSQLCLAGWGGNYQLWESSAIGSFGEAFCYDPEIAHGRAFIDDIRPLNVYKLNDEKETRYDWTGCNGGGNFLLYCNEKGEAVPLTRIRTYYRKQGPNLCEVIYTGITADGAVEAEFSALLPRTDDCSRAVHRFSYRFLKDVAYSRFVLYQFGADHYNDNDWGTMAVGNSQGMVDFSIGDKQYCGEFSVPLPSGEEGEYIGAAGMQQIETPGDGLWFGFFNAHIQKTNFCKNGPVANRLLNLLEFSGELNGKECKKPAFNLYGTVDFGVKCVACELTVPRCERILAGSWLRGAVEYVNLPVEKEYYYGPSEVLRSIPAKEFNTPALAMRYVRGAAVQVCAAKGQVLADYPITVRTENNEAEITVKGGIAYVPLTFTGLTDYHGFRLFKKQKGGAYEQVDQSVHGNDYWQCLYEGKSDTYELTFNVLHSGDPEQEYVYRLSKV